MPVAGGGAAPWGPTCARTFMAEGLRCRVAHGLLGGAVWLVRGPCAFCPRGDRADAVSKPNPAQPPLASSWCLEGPKQRTRFSSPGWGAPGDDGPAAALDPSRASESQGVMGAGICKPKEVRLHSLEVLPQLLWGGVQAPSFSEAPLGLSAQPKARTTALGSRVVNHPHDCLLVLSFLYTGS